jgi:toxin ParE1/3/4
MAYRIVLSPHAQKEIENAIDYYSLYSINAPFNFVSALHESYKVLSVNPFHRIRHKNIRSLKLRRFPYSLYFTINESDNSVKILSCFHDRRNPDKLPK